MRIIRFVDSGGDLRWGCDLRGGEALLLAGPHITALRPARHRVPVRRLLAPIFPTAIFGIGLNYRDHAAETGMPVPRLPVVFMKNPASVTGPGDPILLPACQMKGLEVDYEAELAVIIGRSARDVSPEQALEHVFGYTAANDVSARRWQRHAGGGQWVRGKSFDTFCPLGPVVVTADEIPDPQALTIRTRLNGTLVQDGHTSDMVFSVAHLVAELSRDMTLLPGTIILTGTPAGVGVARTPPVFLAPGDELEVDIEAIGSLRNPVRAAPRAAS